MPGARSVNGYLLAGKDPNTACLGAGKENYWTLRISPIPHPFASFDPKEGPLDGYALHSRCWDLIENRVGSLAMSRLDLIATALRDQWRDIISQECNGETGTTGYLNFKSYHDLDGYKLKDPRFILEVNSLFQDGAQLSTNEDSRNDNSRNLLTYKYKVPPEIKYLIAEYLDLTETYNMLAAFDEKFPVDFWKKHVPTDLIFELENIRDNNTSFWAYIAVEIEKREIVGGWNETWNGIWNRRRILNKISPIKQRVLEAINEEQCEAS